MKKKYTWLTCLVILMALMSIFSLNPTVAYADIYPGCSYSGIVLLNMTHVPAGSVVSAWIDGVSAGPWTSTVQNNSRYENLRIPANSGGQDKNGGT
jgi:hypothetical protein